MTLLTNNGKRERERERELRNDCNSCYIDKESDFYPCDALLSVENTNCHQEGDLYSLEHDSVRSAVDFSSESIAGSRPCNVEDDGSDDPSVLNIERVQVQAQWTHCFVLFFLGFVFACCIPNS